MRKCNARDCAKDFFSAFSSYKQIAHTKSMEESIPASKIEKMTRD
jgi:hypothetical protein